MADTELSEETSDGAVGDSAESDDGNDGSGETVSVVVDGRPVSIDLPPDADSEEAAAIATAVGAHLTDRTRAAAAAAASESEESSDRADKWTLAARMKSMGKRRWPDDVDRGDEWKAAARSFY